MHANPRLTSLATKAEVSDLWGKLHRSLPEHRRMTYETIVAMAACDGKIEDRELKQLEDFRLRHNLSDTTHLEALQKIGFSFSCCSGRCGCRHVLLLLLPLPLLSSCLLACLPACLFFACRLTRGCSCCAECCHHVCAPAVTTANTAVVPTWPLQCSQARA